MPPAADRPEWVRVLHLPPPSLANNTADGDRLREALAKALQTEALPLELSLLKRLPRRLRDWSYAVRCVLFREQTGWRVVEVLDPRERDPVAGLAVDLGTSRLVLRLLDLETGKTLGESAADNPQLALGADVLTRIHATEAQEGLDRLNRLIVDGINQAARDLCRACGLTAASIYLAAVAGNTAMTHLFLGLPCRWMIREPYIPALNRTDALAAAELGLTFHERARVMVFPNIGSYFGGDLIAGILFCGLHRRERTAVLVDVGTNAEVVLGNRSWLIACAGAAGPALEGGVTRMGTMAGPGAIDRVRIDRRTGSYSLHTIGDHPPRGICGSGLIDLAAQLFLAGMIDIRAKYIPAACGERLRLRHGLQQLVVVPEEEAADGRALTLEQADLDSLMRSKAAMYTILETLAGTVGMTPEEVDTFYVAGTFGAFIDPRSAITIGMLPDLPRDRYRSLGNSSLEGAALALTSHRHLDEIERIRERITYLELNVNQDFMNRFSAAKFLPHTDTTRFPSVRPPVV
jgi:uncharacterized 2Fe-2S/4Fe-4S cluster protein (DUF4445 family)